MQSYCLPASIYKLNTVTLILKGRTVCAEDCHPTAVFALVFVGRNRLKIVGGFATISIYNHLIKVAVISNVTGGSIAKD